MLFLKKYIKKMLFVKSKTFSQNFSYFKLFSARTIKPLTGIPSSALLTIIGMKKSRR